MATCFQPPILPRPVFFDSMTTLLVPALSNNLVSAMSRLSLAWREAVGEVPRVQIRPLTPHEWAQLSFLHPKMNARDFGHLQVAIGPQILNISAAIIAPSAVLTRATDFVLITALRAKEFLPSYTLNDVKSVTRVTHALKQWIPRFILARKQAMLVTYPIQLTHLNASSTPMPSRMPPRRTVPPSRPMSSLSSAPASLATSFTSIGSSRAVTPAVPSTDSGYASSEADDIPLGLSWSAAVIEENFGLVRRVFRQMHYKLRTGTYPTPIFSVIPPSSVPSSTAPESASYYFSICIENCFPKLMMSAYSSDISFEVARLTCLFNFCQKLIQFGFFSNSMFEAWPTVARYVRDHREFYDRIFDRVQSNFDQFLAILGSDIPRHSIDDRHTSLICSALEAFRQNAKKPTKTKKFLNGIQAVLPDEIITVNALGVLTYPNENRPRALKLFNMKMLYPADFHGYEQHLMNFIRLITEPHLMTERKHSIRYMLKAWLASTFPDPQLPIVGSTASGCATDRSDLDLVFVYGTSREREHMVDTLRVLYHRLKEFPRTESINFVNAVVPILILTLNAPYDNIRVDIGCNNMCGIYTSQLVERYNAFDHRCQHLVMLVKHWAGIAGIRRQTSGSMSSITLVIMVIHYLQSGCAPSVLPNFQYLRRDLFSEDSISDIDWNDFYNEMPSMGRNLASTGELLIGFFDYYCAFDFEHYGISLEKGGVIHRNEFPLESDSSKMYVEEPFERFNTARGIWAREHIEAIKSAFSQALLHLSGGSINHGKPDFDSFISESGYTRP
uniref:PAP-associated domain-containing protein n=1 Tax=Panagrellus redivivus TaxID=6233 RepID=A0A7E4V655_PANRE